MPRSKTPSTTQANGWGLPQAYVVGAELGRSDAACRVFLATFNGEPAVVRIDSDARALESQSELTLLRTVTHRGLACLLDHGTLAAPGGKGPLRRYVTRRWVEGCEAGRWADGKSADERGLLLLRIAESLAHLHERGFVHGDLKPANVLVGSDDIPVLCDFGFATPIRAGAAPHVQGSLFYISPELLAGAPHRPSADLFALGVMAHSLFVEQRVSAQDFYGRFPQESFFSATQSSASELPELLRDLVGALLSRCPADRPSSAREFAARLAGRLGQPLSSEVSAPAARWPVTVGREGWLDALMAELSGAATDERRDQPPRPRWVRVPTREDPAVLLEELAFEATLAGLDAATIDIETLARTFHDTAALDHGVSEQLDGKPARLLLLSEPALHDDDWTQRAAAHLERAAIQSGRSLVVVSSAAPAASEVAWQRTDAPRLDSKLIERGLRDLLPGEADSRREQLASALAAASSGSATEVDQCVRRACARGWIVRGGDGLQLRPGPAPSADDLAAGDGDSEEDGERPRAAKRLLRVLWNLGGSATLEQLAERIPLPPSELSAALIAARQCGELRAPTPDAPTAFRLGSAGWSAAASLGRDAELANLQREEARRRWRLGDPAEAWLRLLGWEQTRAAKGSRQRTGGAARAARLGAMSLRELRASGHADRVLRLFDLFERWIGASELARHPELIAERALAWLDLGQHALVTPLLTPLAGDSRPAARVAVHLVRGRLAAHQNQPEQALEELAVAAELDPSHASTLLTTRLEILFQRSQYRQLVSCADESLGQLTAGKLREQAYVRSLRAVALARLGETQTARRELEDLLQEARARGDCSREASVAIDLAALERRSAQPSRAMELLERAKQTSAANGDVSMLAHAQALLAALLREQGELRGAQAEVASALVLRERVGDRSGAAVLRGTLGLLLAERGHVHAALEELAAARRGLSGSRLSLHGPLLGAKEAELRARIGSAPANPPEDGDRDPRVDATWARAQWIAGQPELAAARFQAARTAARRLGSLAVAAESELWLCAVRSGIESAIAPAASPDLTPLVAQDRALLRILVASPEHFDPQAARLEAEQLAERGRDDRSARLFLALAARDTHPSAASSARLRAAELLDRCTAGLTSEEARALHACLTGTPDAAPSDLTNRGVQTLRNDDRKDATMNEFYRILELNRRLVAEEEPARLVGSILDSAMDVTGAERGFLVVSDAGQLRFDLARHTGPENTGEPEFEVSKSIVRRTLASGRLLRLSNALEDPDVGQAPSVSQLELRSVLCVPLEIDDRTQAVLYLDHRLRTGAFGERAEILLGMLADQASLALRQAHRVAEIRQLNQALRARVAAQASDLETARSALRDASVSATLGGLVGNSKPIREVRAWIAKVARVDLSVLLIGSSGTGKELAARALHNESHRADAAFVVENCAAIPSGLVEAEFFGYAKGAFTGAERQFAGVFERADGGTLFLDEIGELPLDIQAKFLRVLETGEYRRVGEPGVRHTKFRLIAATNRDLQAEVSQKRFREDLYYRLRGLELRLPDLAERTDDIPALVQHFLRLEEAEHGRARRLAPEVLSKLCAREWPGNVRELRNEIGRLSVLSEHDIDDPALISKPIDTRSLETRPALEPIARPLAAFEREAIAAALKETGGNKSRAAQLLGIARGTLYERLRRFGLE